MRKEARAALDDIGINIPRLNVPVARLSGGQRQAIAVARTVHSEADILLLDEPLAAMGAKEGALILDLIARLKEEGRVSIIMVLHNYVHVLTACDRVNLIQDGVIALDKPTSETSVEELTEIVVEEYRRARQAARAAGGVTVAARLRLRDRRRLRDAVGARRRRARRATARSSGSAVHEYAHGVIERALPATGARLPPQWALQDPEDWLEVLREAVPAGARRGGRRARAGRRHRHRLHRLHAAAGAAPTARRCASCAELARPPARLPEAVEAPRRAARRPTASTRSRASAASRGWRATAGGSPSEWEFAKALQVLEEDPEIYARMDRWIEGADWIVWQLCGRETRNACTAGYKAHPPGRRLPVRGLPARARRALRRLRGRQARGAAVAAGRRAPAA